MLSSRISQQNGGDSTMPGGYEAFSALPRPNVPVPSPSPEPQPMVPTQRTPFPRLPPNSPPGGSPSRTPFPALPGVSPTRGQPMIPRRRRCRRRKRRPLTPDIVIERRSRSHCRSSRGGRRIFTIPLNDRPTLGLRRQPERVIEIERIPCRRIRRRRRRSICYEYDDPLPPPPPPPPPQLATIITNPIPNPCLVTTQPVEAPPSYLTNLSAEMIKNLPKQTVHLPPIHLPGSQANANTELDTIILPVEIINPIDGSLSVIQTNSGTNLGGTMNIQQALGPTQNQRVIIAPTQPQLITIPKPGTTAPIVPRPPPSLSPAMASDPLMQRFQDLFQRLRLPPTRSMQQTPNPRIIRPPAFNIPPNMPMNNTISGPPTISLNNTPMTGNYPSTNTRPSFPTSTMPYRASTFTPSNPLGNSSYRPDTTVPPANSSDVGPYRPANITPYRSSTFQPSAPANSSNYRPSGVTIANPSDTVGPYRPANITSFSNTNNQSSSNSGPTPYTTPPSIASSRSFAPIPPLSSNSQSSPPATYQPNAPMPKSILRNGQSTNNNSNPVYTRLTQPNLFS